MLSKVEKPDEIEKELEKLENIDNSSSQESTSIEVDSVEQPVQFIDLGTENTFDVTGSKCKPVSHVDSTIYDESLCSVCNLSQSSMDCELSKEELNHLLTFILARIRSWVSN